MLRHVFLMDVQSHLFSVVSMTRKQGRRSGRKSKVANRIRSGGVIGAGQIARDARQDKNVSAVEPTFADMNRLVPRQNLKVIAGSPALNNLTYASPVAILLNPISEGSDETARVGDIVRWKELCLNFMVNANANGATALDSILMRVVIIAEYTALGAAATFAQVFGSNTPTPLACRNVSTRNTKRFKMLYDSGPMSINPIGTSAQTSGTGTGNCYSGDPNQICKMLKIPLDLITDYSRGNAGSAADIDTNSITIMMFTDNVTANSSYCRYEYTLEGVNML